MEPDRAAAADYRAAEERQIALALAEEIKAGRPDVILIGRESFLASVVPFAVRHGIPSVLRVAGSQLRSVAAGDFGSEARREFQALLAAVDIVEAQARHVDADLAALGRSDVRFIPNAVDLEAFSPRPKSPGLLRELGIPAGAPVVLHASNLKRVKRPLDVVDSAAKALREIPEAVYVIAGDGPFRNEMERYCRESGIRERFRFAGWVDYERMPDFMNLADAVLMPSQSEQQAAVYLEAQACGRVLVASDVPGARQVVEDRSTGILFRTGDSADCAEKTLLALADSHLARDIGARARKAVRRHELREIAKAQVALLCEAAAGSRRAPLAAPAV